MLSVCIITKNEQQNIERCLQCLKPFDFEIVVVDTGSSDETIKIVQKYTDKIYSFAWCDDFAKARNFAISKASNSYVMHVDSDEFLETIDVEGLRAMIKKHPMQVGRICRRNVCSQDNILQENVEWINRIFDRHKFRYEGRIHEQVTAMNGDEFETYQAPIRFEHIGYDLPPEKREEKARRNTVLLERELELLTPERKEKEKPYLLYQLGKSAYMVKDYMVACKYFEEALSFDLNPQLEFVIDMVETYGYALLNSGQTELALSFENIYDTFGKNADFQFLMGLIYMNNARFEDAIKEFEKAVTHKECRCKGVNSYMSHYNIGVIYECLGEREKAMANYEKCGTYELAQKRRQNLVLEE